MKKIVLLIILFVVGAYAQAGNGWLSRYWDGCKPSCAWSGKPSNGQGQCKECDKNNNKLNTSDANRNACEQGGTSYTCWDMAPWAVDNNTAYGFAAGHNDGQCGTCWQLTFNGGTNNSPNTNASSLNGKKLIVMISNIGGDVAGNQLDFLVPGGGVGAFDAFSSQIGVSKSDLGAQYGGLVNGCQGNPSCLKQKCNSVFSKSGQEWLKAGCNFYADWMGAVDNPTYNAVSVTCPAALTDRWKNAATGTPGSNSSTSSSSNNNTGARSSSSVGNSGSNCGSVVTASEQTTKIEAECYTSKNGANMVTESANGITSIGYIENGYSTTYKVSIPSGRAGQYTMRFRIATEVQSNFTVKVNGNNVGRIDQGNTGNWNTYIDKELSSKAQFNNGENTIVLEFGSAVNVDYFLIIGGPLPSSSSARSSSSSALSSSSSLPLSSSSYSSSSSVDPVPILRSPNAITFESLASNTTVEVYNLQGKLIYSGNAENSKILVIPIQTKGMYIVKIKSGSEIKLLRVPVM